jgi:hypothetical protein
MKQIILSSLLAWMALKVGVHAQAAYAGSYNSIAGYYSGSAAGYFGYGTTTVSRSGAVSYSEYWPAWRETSRGTGRVDRNGLFSLTGGVTGSAVIYSSRIAYGTFRVLAGRGYFAMSKK